MRNKAIRYLIAQLQGDPHPRQRLFEATQKVIGGGQRRSLRQQIEKSFAPRQQVGPQKERKERCTVGADVDGTSH